MPFIDCVPEEEATGAAAALYARARESHGYLPNMFKVFSHRPEYMEAWVALVAAIRARMESRRYELATLAAALELESSYCALAHGSVLLRDFFSERELRDIVADFRTAELHPLDIAVMEFATTVARDATAVSFEDVEALRRRGLTDGEISDVAAAAAARCFFCKFLDALGAAPDAAYAMLSPTLREALALGRAIEPDAPAPVE